MLFVLALERSSDFSEGVEVCFVVLLGVGGVEVVRNYGDGRNSIQALLILLHLLDERVKPCNHFIGSLFGEVEGVVAVGEYEVDALLFEGGDILDQVVTLLSRCTESNELAGSKVILAVEVSSRHDVNLFGQHRIR